MEALPATESSPAVRDMFGRIAPTYDLLNRVLSAGIDRSWRARAIRTLTDAPSGAVLDLCAGTMDLSALLEATFPADRIVAADFSPEMLALGRHKAPRSERVVADAMALPFADASFSRVVCAFGMRNVADPGRAIREAARVLVPGGIFTTLEFFRPVRVPTRVFHAVYASAVLPRIGALVSGDRDAYAYLARSMKAFQTRDAYAALLASSGFVGVEHEDLTLGVASLVTARVPS